ncbi:RNA 2',3'-cyclic phosphodiesterase [Salipiger sp.]|uniref:RNA 2',3'-cyclic phosphodiesterase n=1 Tax=Salipiger sp. TaxID=2078585 RepID=UPI003A96C85F
MRCFLALPLPEEMIGPLLHLQEAIPVGREVPEENLHVTMAFLGNQDRATLEELHMALEMRRFAAAALAVRGLSVIGGRVPKLLAADLARTAALRALRDAVAGAVRAARVTLPRERFRPHVTLVRFGGGLKTDDAMRLDRALRGLAGFVTSPAEATALRLVASHLTPDGAIYETLAEYPLAPPPGQRATAGHS